MDVGEEMEERDEKGGNHEEERTTESKSGVEDIKVYV